MPEGAAAAGLVADRVRCRLEDIVAAVLDGLADEGAAVITQPLAPSIPSSVGPAARQWDGAQPVASPEPVLSVPEDVARDRPHSTPPSGAAAPA